MTKLFIFLFFFLISGICPLTPAHAACATPTGVAGDMIYNRTSHVIQYCNGAVWIPASVNGDVTNGLVGYWKFDEGTGTSAADSTGNGNTGTLTLGPTWTTGKFGTAVNFDKVNDYVTVAGSASLNDLTSFTYAAWIYPLSKGESASGCTSVIINRADQASTGVGEKQFCLNDSVGNNYYTFIDTNNVAATITTGLNTVTYSTWQHVVMTYNGTTSTATIYKDGVSIGSNTGSGVPHTENPKTLLIGNNYTQARTFDGKIDEVRVYNRVLSAAEVAQLYAYSVPTSDVTSGLVSRWQLDESGNTSTAADSVGGNNGTLANFPADPTANWVAGKINNALSLDGVNDSVTVTDPVSGNLDFGVASFSFGAWFKTTDAVHSMTVVGKKWSGSCGAGDSGYDFGGSGGNFAGRVCDNANNIYTPTWNGKADGAWHHFMVVTDRAAQMLRLYGDGAQIGADVSISGEGSVSSATDFKIGDFVGGGVPFLGQMDDVRVYNRALSAAEVTQIYNVSSACGGPAGNEGDVIYNSTSNVLQFCDSRNWIPMGTNPGAGGAGCLNPAGVKGDTIFNKDYDVMQYCDGTNWQLIGNLIAPTSGLVSWWKLDESAGPTAVDSSGTGNNGTWSNNPTPIAGKLNNGLDFNSAAVYTATLMTLSAGTVSTWVKYDSLNAVDDRVVVGSQPGCISGQTLMLGRNPANGFTGNGFGLYDGATGWHWPNTGVEPTLGTWYHIAGTWGPAGVKFYQNGVLIGTDAAWTTGITNLTIQMSHCGSFDGKMDDVRAYNRALNAAEVCTLYQATGGTSACP